MPRITAWRIVAPWHADTAFSGIGAERFGGRFNSKGRRAVYMSGSISLAMLEMLVQANRRERLAGHVCLSATFDAAYVETVEARNLPPGWDARPYAHASQRFGDAWLNEGRSLILQVPSVVVPQEYNYLFNPLHPDVDGIEFGEAFPAPFDERLMREGTSR